MYHKVASTNASRFVTRLVYMHKSKNLGFRWKKASLGVPSPCINRYNLQCYRSESWKFCWIHYFTFTIKIWSDLDFLRQFFLSAKLQNISSIFCTNHSRVNQEFYHQHCRWFTLILFDILRLVFFYKTTIFPSTLS